MFHCCIFAPKSERGPRGNHFVQRNMEISSYRPRNAGHDYYGRGTYLITLVVSGREPLLSRFETGKGGNRLMLTPLGEAVREAWLQTPERQLAHGNRVAVHASVCMPDHFHGVIEVLEPMQWSLDDIMQAFKAVCTTQWQQGQGLPSSINRPISDDCWGERAQGGCVRRLLYTQAKAHWCAAFPSGSDRNTMPLWDESNDRCSMTTTTTPFGLTTVTAKL